MIAKCRRILNSTAKEEIDHSIWISRDREYVVLALLIFKNLEIKICIQSDSNNEPIFAPLLGFEVISEHVPSNWQMGIVSEVFRLSPKSWMRADFYEDFEERKPEAIELFKKEAEIIYREEGLEMPALLHY
jgi:hypothetical protein